MTALHPLQVGTGTPGTPTPDTPAQAMYTGYERFPRPAPRVQPLITFEKPKSKFHDPLTDAKSDMLRAQYRLSLLQWNAGAARRQPTQLITVMCGAFHAVLLQEAADHEPSHHEAVPHIHGRRQPGHLTQQRYVPARCGPVPDQRRNNKQNSVGSQGVGGMWVPTQTSDRRPEVSHTMYTYTTLLLRSET